MKKVLFLEELLGEIEKLKEAGKRVVFTNGCFDILHIGHARYLEEARRNGDVLVVGVNSDASVRLLKGTKRPIVPQEERAELLAALSVVDFVTIFDEETPLELISSLHPDVIVKGGDWKCENIVGAKLVEGWGGRVVIAPLVEGSSTTNIIAKVCEVYGGCSHKEGK